MSDIIKWYGKKVFDDVLSDATRRMNYCARFLERDVKSKFGTGKLDMTKSYKVTKGGKIHHPAAAGEIPNILNGHLRASIGSEVVTGRKEVIGYLGVDDKKLAAKADVGTDVKYGLYLEVGTTKMAARPYLRPSLYRNRKMILNILGKK